MTPASVTLVVTPAPAMKRRIWTDWPAKPRSSSKPTETNRNKPFLAYFSFYPVHTPVMTWEDLQAKYEAKRQRLGLTAQWGQEHEREVRLVQEHAVYAGMVEAMDQAVGKVLAKLEELGLRGNTLVIFTSDNGGLSTSEGWPRPICPCAAARAGCMRAASASRCCCAGPAWCHRAA